MWEAEEVVEVLMTFLGALRMVGLSVLCAFFPSFVCHCVWRKGESASRICCISGSLWHLHGRLQDLWTVSHSRYHLTGPCNIGVNVRYIE